MYLCTFKTIYIACNQVHLHVFITLHQLPKVHAKRLIHVHLEIGYKQAQLLLDKEDNPVGKTCSKMHPIFSLCSLLYVQDIPE